MKSPTNDPDPTARPTGADAMRLRLSLDRFEGDKKEIAVLLADDGTTIDFPGRLLPKDARAGDILALTIERDAAATRRAADATRKVQDELEEADPGGDIKI